LTSAKYPSSNSLPKGYRNTVLVAAAPITKLAEKAAADVVSVDMPPAAGNILHGFRF